MGTVRGPQDMLDFQYSSTWVDGRCLCMRMCVVSWAPVSGMREWQTLCSLRVRNKQHFVPQKHYSAFLLSFPQEQGLWTRGKHQRKPKNLGSSGKKAGTKCSYDTRKEETTE